MRDVNLCKMYNENFINANILLSINKKIDVTMIK